MNNQILNQEQKDTSSMGAVVVWGIILLVAVFIVYQVAFKKDNAAILDTVSKDVFVAKTEKVQKRDLKHQLITSGNVKALEEAVLYPRINGKLQKNVLKEGDRVRKDQTVSLID
ncbi:MAG: hypothetical protein K5622_04245, partial [Endomicrobiaceae bacterium]|nr:hypothetical protein [Endomicrobiaceae bacterium]